MPLPRPSVFCHSASRASAFQRIPMLSLTFERKRILTNLLEIETTVQLNSNTVIKKKKKKDRIIQYLKHMAEKHFTLSYLDQSCSTPTKWGQTQVCWSMTYNQIFYNYRAKSLKIQILNPILKKTKEIKYGKVSNQVFHILFQTLILYSAPHNCSSNLALPGSSCTLGSAS